LYQNTDYGKDYRLGTYETGSMVHAHVGYVILEIKTRFQPYVSYDERQML
jgi:hypothetical protein